MATVPGQLIWEMVKKNNCFLVKEFGRGNAGVQFSKEPNNLFNLNSFKYSGKSLHFLSFILYVCELLVLTISIIKWWWYVGLANRKTVMIQPGGKDLSDRKSVV